MALKWKQAGRAPGGETEVDMKKVEAVKHALADGAYEINPDRIAEKLIRRDSLLGARCLRRSNTGDD